jgi:hypothetical protein
VAASCAACARRPMPLNLLVTQAGADEIETLLRRIDFGVYT